MSKMIHVPKTYTYGKLHTKFLAFSNDVECCYATVDRMCMSERNVDVNNRLNLEVVLFRLLLKNRGIFVKPKKMILSYFMSLKVLE